MSDHNIHNALIHGKTCLTYPGRHPRSRCRGRWARRPSLSAAGAAWPSARSTEGPWGRTERPGRPSRKTKQRVSRQSGLALVLLLSKRSISFNWRITEYYHGTKGGQSREIMGTAVTADFEHDRQENSKFKHMKSPNPTKSGIATKTWLCMVSESDDNISYYSFTRARLPTCHGKLLSRKHEL